jgi:hypothetical protein
MILDNLYFSEAKRGLQCLVEGGAPALPMLGAPLDRYIGLSLLQKAIRRSEIHFALAAARYLLCENGSAFWKRLAIIAVEDIGIANIPLVSQVIVAAGDKPLRQELGGSECVASALVQAMCLSLKDRSTDDLFDVLDRDASYNCRKAALSEMQEQELWETYDPNAGNVEQNALTLVELATTWSRFSAYVGKRSRWLVVMNSLPEETVSPVIKWIATLGLQKTGLILAPFLCVLAPVVHDETEAMDDRTLPELLISGVPSWAFGMHTRVGLAAFRTFASRSPDMKSLISGCGPSDISRSKGLCCTNRVASRLPLSPDGLILQAQ